MSPAALERRAALPPVALACVAVIIGVLGALGARATDSGVQPSWASVVATGWTAVALGVAVAAYTWRRRAARAGPGRLDAWLSAHLLISLMFLPAVLVHASLGARGGLGTIPVGAALATLMAALAAVATGALLQWLYVRAPTALRAERSGLERLAATLDTEAATLRTAGSPALRRAAEGRAGGTALDPVEAGVLARIRELEERGAEARRLATTRLALAPVFVALVSVHVGATVVLGLFTVAHVWSVLEGGPDLRSAARRYPSAEDCAACHRSIVEEWRLSPHANALSPETVAMNRASGTSLNATCLGCHAPVAAQLGHVREGSAWMRQVEDQAQAELALAGAVSPEPRAPAAWDGGAPASAYEGVTCVVCHGGAHALRGTGDVRPLLPGMTEGPFALPAFGTAHGPFGAGTSADPPPLRNAYHRSRMDAVEDTSVACAACHDVTLTRPDAEPGEPTRVALQETTAEWRRAAAPAGKEKPSCQACHMPAVKGSPEGRGGYGHAFAGVDAPGRTLSAPERTEALEGTVALLDRSAKLQVVMPPGAAPEADVVLANAGTFHDLPTGFTFERELWLEVTAFDASGRATVVSGMTDGEGRLLDERNPDVRAGHAALDERLVNLRGRMVALDVPRPDWVTDGRLTVPDSVLDGLRNANGTLVLDAPGLHEVFLQTEAEAVIKEGLAHGEARHAAYPLPPGTVGVRVRLLLRPLPVHVVTDVLQLPPPSDAPVHVLARSEVGRVPTARP